MPKTAQMQIRIDPELKTDAENILSKIGLSPTEFVRMSLRQLVMRRGLPFDASIPNNETIDALETSLIDRGAKRLKSYSGEGAFDEMLDDIMSNDD